MSSSHTRARVGRSINSTNPRRDAPSDVHSVRDLLTSKEVAERCRTSESTVRYWRSKNVGPRCYKVGRRVLYPEHYLNLWLHEQRDLDADRRN